MKLFSQPKTSLLACLLGGLSAFAVGCVITVGEDGDAGANECGDLLSHSEQVGDQCFCDAGYDWCTSDPDDFDCCKTTPKPSDDCNEANNEVVDGECFCAQGYTWCTDDPDDFSCCESNQGENTSQSGTGTGTDSETNGTESDSGTTSSETEGLVCDLPPPPESCDPETELAFCTSTEESCTQESEYYICNGGVWELGNGDIDCDLIGFDFSYGCIDENRVVDQLCGTGPGTPCANSDADYCGDDDILNYCVHGKLGATSCLEQCQILGDDMGVTYDFGSCGEQEGEFKCLCCDEVDEGCGEDGGSSSSSSSSSSSGSSTGG